MNYNHASIAELEGADELSWAEVYEILSARAQRPDSRSARRSQAWCDAHPEHAPKRARKASAKKITPAKPAKPSKADPVKAMRAECANATGAARGSAEWWDAYKGTRGESLADLEALRAKIAELANA